MCLYLQHHAQEWLWYKGGEVTARGPALQLTNVTRGDGAEYWCEAANSEGVGQSGRVTVTVTIQPSLSLSILTITPV